MIVQGVTSGGLAKPLLVDASGRVIFTSPQPSALRPTSQHSRLENLNLPAGTSSQTLLTVPAGQYWRMTGITYRYVGTVAGVSLTVRLEIAAVAYPFQQTAPPVSGTFYTTLVNILLDPGYIVSVAIAGATLNDDFLGIAFCERIE